METSGTDPVSVVVSVHDRVDLLERLLDALLAQQYPEYEIVIVNDGPHEDIAVLMAPVTAQHPHVRYIAFDASRKTYPGKKAPLDAGIRAAQHAWILLTDGDCVPGPQWIRTMMACRDGRQIVLGYAPMYPAPGPLNMLQCLDTLITAMQYMGAAIRGRAYMGVGRNMLYHREVFDAAKGFTAHEDVVSGDDDLFIQSASVRFPPAICLQPEAFVYSKVTQSWGSWIRQKRRHLSAASRYTGHARLLTTAFATTFICTWILWPVMLTGGGKVMSAGLIIVGLLWLLFAAVAVRWNERRLVPGFPLLAVVYALWFILQGFLFLMKRPVRWK